MIVIFTILCFYALVLIYLAIGFIRTKTHRINQNNEHHKVSIIICARNEEKNIAHCLTTLLSQDYPQESIEIIFVDDASNDQTLMLAQNILFKSQIQFQIIKNNIQKGKKLSITQAIQQAKHELIITRDADTFTKSNLWLMSLISFQKQTESDLVIAPVAIPDNVGIFWALQAIENNILMVMACGSNFYHRAFLCNGANLAFTKSIFFRTNGYQSHLHIASGDDVLFLEDVKKIPHVNINYLKAEQALVYTYPNYSFRALLNQKVRWAAKFKHNPNKLNFILAVLSFTVNLLWLYCFVYGLIRPNNNGSTQLFILSKILIDFLLLLVASTFIKSKNLLWYSLPVACVYPIYTCIVALASIFVKPKWKDKIVF